MNATQALRGAERVADWPRISATVRADGTGTITINGTGRTCAAAGVNELRTGMIARCVAIANRLHRPVRVTVTDVAQTWTLAVRPEGIVQAVSDAGLIPPADGLSVHEGRCRRCRRLQAVTSTTCPQCGVDEPHRVEADPIAAEAIVPDASAVDELDLTRARPLTTTPEPRATLRLTFSSQSPVDVAENVALGRNPEAVGGRRPIQVRSPQRMLSRTHVLVDVDEHGRILVTDHGSGNGTESQTNPPRLFEAHVPYVLAPGTTLRLGDVICRIDLV